MLQHLNRVPLLYTSILAHNRDDHSKNFTFLMNEVGEWKLSPGYDLTFSSGPGGVQSTMVMGEGHNITIQHLIKLGLEAKLPKELINNIIEQTRAALNGWSALAKEYGVAKDNITLINRMIKRL